MRNAGRDPSSGGFPTEIAKSLLTSKYPIEISWESRFRSDGNKSSIDTSGLTSKTMSVLHRPDLPRSVLADIDVCAVVCRDSSSKAVIVIEANQASFR